ncbi:uncharacterized protein LOC142329934 [Lycorma delicatula]|uniref:uncharacterized protein LOC142329934 n=1 Tax=Lycorma delicatula TaxID=130591 RepID=UPI003F51A7C0
MACDLIAGLKVIEVFLCVVCLIYKLWTIWETLRVFYELEKQSREWPLSRRLAVDRTGSIFSDIVLGSYVIITIGLLLGHLRGELVRAKTTEGFFLVLGTILFLIVGGLSITSVDELPHKLVDNGIILGILTIATAIVFLIDIGLSRKQPGNTEISNSKTKTTPIKLQKQPSKLTEVKPSTQIEKVDEEDKNKKKSMFQELKSSLKRRSTSDEINRPNTTVIDKTVEFQEQREFHDNERQTRTTVTPQVGRRNMENRGFNTKYKQEEREDDDDIESRRRTFNPEEFERSFTKVKSVPNGFIKNEDRQTAFSTRDDERYYLRNGNVNYGRRENEGNISPFTRTKEYQSDRYNDNYRQKSNGYIKTEERSLTKEEFHRPNGYVRHGDDSDITNKQRRHSIDYIERDDRISMKSDDHFRRQDERILPNRTDDHFRRSEDYQRGKSNRSEESPRSYRRDPREDYKRTQEKYEFEELRKPEYTDDMRNYKGYADTVKYLEQTSSEKHKEVTDDNDSAMPPKHVIEVELDDHFYRPIETQMNRSEPKNDDRSTLQVAKVTSSQKIGNNNGSSDDSELIPQIPSVSFLLSERGRKIMPSLSTSPVERVTTPPQYYFSDPSSPGYVKQTASNWPTASPVRSPDLKNRPSQ